VGLSSMSLKVVYKNDVGFLIFPKLFSGSLP